MAGVQHDRLFKELLRNFFVEFLELFLPKVARYVRKGSIEFLDKEIFTDISSNEAHEVDLLAKVRFRGHDAFFLIHVETQASRQHDFAKRMFKYFSRLHEKHDLPVYPIALLSYDSPRTEEPNRYEVRFPDRCVLEFGYAVIQLNRLNWRDFLRHRNPVASALMAKMSVEPKDRVRVKLECLRLLVTMKLKRARARLISGFVDQYLKLSAAEARRFFKEVKAMPATAQKGVFELTTSWKEEGRQEGRQVGRQEGQLDLIARLLQRRIGSVSPALRGRLNDLSLANLERFGEALLDFNSAHDVDAWLNRSSGKRAKRR